MSDNMNVSKTKCSKLFDIWSLYAQRIDLIETVKECEEYYNGEQWATKNKKNMLRITVNFIADAIRKIASKLNGTPLYFSYTSSDDSFDGSKLARYDGFVRNKLGHEAFSLQSAINGENIGIEITYCGWDSDAPWAVGSFFNGGLFEEHIDLRNFAVENPHQPNIQKQKWVMIWHDIFEGELEDIINSEPLSKKEKKRRIELLQKTAIKRASTPEDQNPDKDIINSTLIRTYFRFFRVKGEVCYEMETDDVSIYAFPKPLSKICSQAIAKKVQEAYDEQSKENADGERELVRDLEIDFENTIASGLIEEVGEDEKREQREKFSLYPFAIFVPKRVNGSILGRSMTYELIPAQNGYNYGITCASKALENIGFDKTYVRKGALPRGEVFETGPESNVQVDNYTGNGNGFYKISSASIPAEVMKIPDFILQSCKASYNFSDFANGEMANQETSGYAVSLMLKQANSSLEQEQKLFWQYQTDLALIRLMFYKHYIGKAQYTYEMPIEEYEAEENARKNVLNIYASGGQLNSPSGQPIPFEQIWNRFSKPTRRQVVELIKGNDLFGHDFDLKIVAQQGLVESQLSTQQWYTSMFGNGAIAAYEQNPEILEFVIKTSPDGVIPEDKRASMIYYVESMKRSRIRQLEAQVQQLSEQLQQAIDFGKQQENQFKQSMNAAREMVTNAQSERDNAIKERDHAFKTLKELGVNEGEIHSNNAKGIKANEQLALAQQGNPI